MLKKIFIFCALFIPTFALAANDTYSIDDLLKRDANDTPCAREIYERALSDTANMIENPDDAATDAIDTWAHYAFNQETVIQAVLDCPEIKKITDENEAIIFETVSYTFPQNGRMIEINYETTKKILQQKLLLAQKHDLTPGDINPDIVDDASNGVLWVNVDPAWYAILVAEHGSLDEYVQPNRTNVLSLKFIENNVGKFYPRDHNTWPAKANCTSKTAWALDSDMINRATTRTVGGGSPKYTPSTDAEKEQADVAKSNDYYVLGDGNLSWVMYGEIAIDVIVSVISWGGYAVVKGVLTAARGARAFAKATKAMKALKSSRSVARWFKASNTANDIAHAIKTIDKIEDSYTAIIRIERNTSKTLASLTRKRELLKARKADPKIIKTIEQELEVATKQAKAAKDAAETATKMRKAQEAIDKVDNTKKTIANLEKELKQTKDNLTTLQKNSQLYRTEQGKMTRLENNLKGTKNQLKTVEKNAEKAKTEITQLKNTYNTQLDELKKINAADLKNLEKTKDVKSYQELAKSRRELAHNVYLIRQGKVAFQAQRGLLPVRAFRAAKALRKGLKSAKKMDKAVKVVRANTSGFSARVNDWLFHNTMKNITALSKVPATLSTFNVVGKAAFDMYDGTSTSTDSFTNNIDMKPYLLLGADNLPDYENEVNYGMWIFWAGSSTSAADDDAAFLQAMDFADKFHQDLIEVQDEYDNAACDVDIYVVRPIIRNPGTENEELYYLFMNDKPWTTHDFNNISADTVTRTTDADGNTTYTVTTPSGETRMQNYSDTNIVTTVNAVADNTYVAPSANGEMQISSTNGTTGGRGKLKYTEPPYDGSKIGGDCTPPTKSGGDNFTSAILTTGRYKKYPAFEKAMITKFRTEGDCGKHPDDPGGYTCYGVSSNFFPQVKNKNFSRADAEDIAYNSFWHKYKIDQLPDAISGDVFMALWGTGSLKESVGVLQRLLGIKQTNRIDQETINAAKNYTGDLRTQYLNEREKFFKRANPTFRKGWLNGLELYRANGCHTRAHN